MKHKPQSQTTCLFKRFGTSLILLIAVSFGLAMIHLPLFFDYRSLVPYSNIFSIC